MNLFHNRHDFSQKADWQSQLVISKVPNAVSTSMGILKQGLTQTRDWWDLELRAENELDQRLTPFWKDLMRAEIEERDEDQRDFLDNWIVSVTNAWYTGPVVLKFTVAEVQDRLDEMRVVEPEKTPRFTPSMARAMVPKPCRMTFLKPMALA